MPLTGLAQQRLDAVARLAKVDLPGATDLLGERARLNELVIPGQVSANGGCQFYRAANGWIALNLARPDDADLLPAMLETNVVDPLADAIAARPAEELLARGRMLGLAIAALDEFPLSPSVTLTTSSEYRPNGSALKVLDLSALWAGPLASRLLRLAGCDVVRIESRGREDPLRESDPAHFAALNHGKDEVALDLRSGAGRAQCIQLLRDADIVIEAARPRALLQLGIDADELVREQASLTWVTITAHGITGDAANWVGFGDDTAVAGGLSRELLRATGKIGFVGDAIGDPLTGIAAAELVLRKAKQGSGGRHVLSMSALVAEAIGYERQTDADRWYAILREWDEAQGQPMALREASASC